MENNYLNSENVKVFPLGSSRESDPYGRTLNEQNIATLVRRTTDKESYVVSYTKSDTSTTLEFVLCGYYFRASSVEGIAADDDSSIYANIQITEDNDYKFLAGSDVTTQLYDANGKFKGLKFTSKPEEGYKSLHVLEKTGNEWDVPKTSKYMFEPESLHIDIIRCGGAEIFK